MNAVAPRSRLLLHETLLYALALAATLTLALATSPLWPHLPDVSALFPPSYTSMLRAFPFEPNTTLAFFALATGALGSLFILRQPVIGLGVITATTLGIAAYPFGRIYWHRVFIRLPLEDQTPSLGDWLVLVLPVLLLLVGPVVLQVRTLLDRYKGKNVDDDERRQARDHLVGLALRTAATATGFALGMGILLFLLLPDLATGRRFLVQNSLIVMAIVALLLVLAIGIGTGVFRRSRTATTDEGDAAAR